MKRSSEVEGGNGEMEREREGNVMRRQERGKERRDGGRKRKFPR